MSEIKKRKLKSMPLLIIALIACTAVGVGAKYATAYFIHGDQTTNIFSPGNNEIEIPEEFPTPTPDEVGENIHTKVVKIENTGNVPTYTRVLLEVSDASIADNIEYSWDDTTFYSIEDFRNNLPEGWVYDATDGYYYYTKVLEVGDTTTNLISRVKVTLPSEDDKQQFDILVLAESVQSQSGNDGSNIDYKQAWTEFEAKK